MAESPEDLSRLLGAVSGWARENLPPPPGGTAGTTCEWCPLCQFAAVLRGERPDIADRVVEAGTALLVTMRQLLDPGPPARPRPRPRPRIEDE